MKTKKAEINEHIENTKSVLIPLIKAVYEKGQSVGLNMNEPAFICDAFNPYCGFQLLFEIEQNDDPMDIRNTVAFDLYIVDDTDVFEIQIQYYSEHKNLENGYFAQIENLQLSNLINTNPTAETIIAKIQGFIKQAKN